VLKTITLLFNPVTPYLSETLYQNVYRQLTSNLPETVNLENWPKPDEGLRNKAVEDDFQTLFSTVSLVYSARQSAKLKRRWPLSRMVVVAPEKTREALKSLEDLLLELTNVKVVEYAEMPAQHVPEEGWVSAAENGTQVFLDVHRDQKLLGEGAMRDLARRVQALRKELGYMPTDILDDVYMAELDNETVQLLQPYLQEMKELIRARNIHLLVSRGETGTDWHESQLDERKVYIAIRAQNKKPSV
jgi:valyl-tRNA synthetase